MTSQEHRNRVEINALVLGRARWLLERAHLRLIMLGDIKEADRINSITKSVETERRRWLHIVDSPLP
jgi:hypothetical protein